MLSHKASSLKFAVLFFYGRIDVVRSVKKHGTTAKQVNLLARIKNRAYTTVRPVNFKKSLTRYFMMLGIYGMVAKTISRLPPIKLSYHDL